MNRKIFYNRNIIFYFLLFQRIGIPNYIVEYIIEQIIPLKYTLKCLFNLLDEIQNEFIISKNISYYENKWCIEINKINSFQSNDIIKYPFIKDNHTLNCSCELCTILLDFPRYIYLLSQINKRITGHYSKSIRHWYLLLFYILLTSNDYNRNTSYYINKYKYTISKQISYGFCSMYNKLIKEEGYNIHPCFKNKGIWIQCMQIWKNLTKYPDLFPNQYLLMHNQINLN